MKMDFISLANVLKSKANAVSGIQLTNEDSKAEKEAKEAQIVAEYSRVAAELHQKLHNSGQRPKWVEINKETGLPLFNDAVADEGMSILLHMAGWKRRTDEERNNHNFACLTSGLDPAEVPQGYSVNGGQYNWWKIPFLRETNIGFDRSEFMAFLGANESEQQETPAQRRKRIQDLVNNNFSKGITKAESFRKLAATEACSVDNIKRIYYEKG